jgi:hypothetical protein
MINIFLCNTYSQRTVHIYRYMPPPSSSFDFISATEEPGASQADILSTTPKLACALPSTYQLRLQSNRLHDDVSYIRATTFNDLLSRDLEGRLVQVADTIATAIFPDTAFGFPITDQFTSNFRGTFITRTGFLDPSNFYDEKGTATFLNRTISTIAHFLKITKQSNLKPHRYFTAQHSTKPVDGSTLKRMPDVAIVRLINGCTREGRLNWIDIQAIIEHTREKKPPVRMATTTTIKAFLMFNSQPERDFVLSLCITRECFHIVTTDHVGQVETDVIAFSRASSVTIFLRLLMGLAFLPDKWLGVDNTITRRELGKSSGCAFETTYLPFSTNFSNPSILFALPPSSASTESPLAVTFDPVIDGCDTNFSTIAVDAIKYPVVSVLFQAQTLIGRATRVFLVKLSDGRLGVLKDAWITADRETEANLIKGLLIPFGPDIVGHCTLRNTTPLRSFAVASQHIAECREKRRIVTFPAGVHISDFSSCWELMIAVLDVIIGMSDSLVVLGLSYPSSSHHVPRV